MSAAQPQTVGMHNTKGEFVDLYIPRKWYRPILLHTSSALRATSSFLLLHLQSFIYSNSFVLFDFTSHVHDLNLSSQLCHWPFDQLH
jgi:hypothetical protein